MKKINWKSVIVLFSIAGLSLSIFQAEKALGREQIKGDPSISEEKRQENESRYTLLGVSHFKFTAKMSCEIVAMVDYQLARLKIIRLGERGSEYNLNHLRSSPDSYSGHGKIFEIASLFTDIDLENLDSIETVFRLKNKERNLKIIAHLRDGSQTESLEPIDEFFNDNPTKCLK